MMSERWSWSSVGPAWGQGCEPAVSPGATGAMVCLEKMRFIKMILRKQP